MRTEGPRLVSKMQFVDGDMGNRQRQAKPQAFQYPQAKIGQPTSTQLVAQMLLLFDQDHSSNQDGSSWNRCKAVEIPAGPAPMIARSTVFSLPLIKSRNILAYIKSAYRSAFKVESRSRAPGTKLSGETVAVLAK